MWMMFLPPCSFLCPLHTLMTSTPFPIFASGTSNPLHSSP
jgi:hypothetical protein